MLPLGCSDDPTNAKQPHNSRNTPNEYGDRLQSALALLLAATLLFNAPAFAQPAVTTRATAPTNAPPAASATSPVTALAQSEPDIETLLVVGTQPGPGMWKVSLNDNVLWIVGSQTPALQKMKWRAKGVEATVAKAQEVLGEPSLSVSMKQIGYFRALTLLPSAMEVQKNPDNGVLRDIIPPAQYARWLVLREKYIEGYNTEDNDIERWRPVFAALTLYRRAIEKIGMTNRSVVWPVVQAAAKKHKVKITEVRFAPAIDNARAAVKELNKTRLEDLDCFVKTLDRIETDIAAMRSRANAWAVGDIDAIRALPAIDQRTACINALQNANAAKLLGVGNLEAKVAETWLTAAETALKKNKVTLAVLPMNQLLAPTGYLAQLKARGYVVEMPE